MAEETFIILERAGSGYIMKSTEGRDDQSVHIIDIRQALTSFGAADTLEIETPFDVKEWSVVVTGARIVRLNTAGGYDASPTAVIRGMNSNVRSTANLGVDRWLIHLDYTGVNPTLDVCYVTVYAGKTAQISRSNITNN